MSHVRALCALGVGAIGAMLISHVAAFEVRHRVEYGDLKPVTAIIVTSFNRRNQLAIALAQVLKLTYYPSEIFVMDDGSEDGAVEGAIAVLRDYPNWKPCRRVQTNVRWPDGRDVPEFKTVGERCRLGRMVQRAQVIVSRNQFESAQNNFAMRNSSAEYYVWMQDDNFLTAPDWDYHLIHPLAVHRDAFSASMRCAHSWPTVDNLVGAKCTAQNANETARYAYYVRDTGNRGPIAFSAPKMRKLGFVDLRYAGVTPNDVGDHEVNTRAWTQFGWVSGFVPVPFTAFSSVPGRGRAAQSAAMQIDSQSARAIKERLQMQRPFVPNTHNEVRG